SGCSCASRSAPLRRPRRISDGCKARWRRAGPNLRSSSRRRRASGTACATSSSATGFTSPRWRRSPIRRGASAILAAAPGGGRVGACGAGGEDEGGLQGGLAARRTKSQEFFSSSAGQWDRVRDELFGDRFHLAAMAALADPAWVVGDLGCGTGRVTAALAPFV